MAANDPAFNLEAVLREQPRPRHDPPTLEDWRAVDVLALAGHLKKAHDSALEPDSGCSACSELVWWGWQGVG